MSDVTALIQTTLEADATLVGYLTGGIFTKREIGSLGIDQKNGATSSAYVLDDGYPVLRPCLVVRQRGAIPGGGRVDVPTQVTSVRQVVELWFYDKAGFTTIESARSRCKTILQMKTLAGVGRLNLVNNIDDIFAPEMDKVAMLRADYQLTRKE